MFFFLRTRKPKKFDFKPVYYDPDKEELERKLAEEEKVISFKHHSSTKDQMYKRWDRISYADVAKQGRKRILIITVTTAVLVFGFAYVLIKFAYLLEQE